MSVPPGSGGCACPRWSAPLGARNLFREAGLRGGRAVSDAARGHRRPVERRALPQRSMTSAETHPGVEPGDQPRLCRPRHDRREVGRTGPAWTPGRGRAPWCRSTWAGLMRPRWLPNRARCRRGRARGGRGVAGRTRTGFARGHNPGPRLLRRRPQSSHQESNPGPARCERAALPLSYRTSPPRRTSRGSWCWWKTWVSNPPRRSCKDRLRSGASPDRVVPGSARGRWARRSSPARTRTWCLPINSRVRSLLRLEGMNVVPPAGVEPARSAVGRRRRIRWATGAKWAARDSNPEPAG